MSLQPIMSGTDKTEGDLASEKALLEEGRELVFSSDHLRLKLVLLKKALTVVAPMRELTSTLYVRTRADRCIWSVCIKSQLYSAVGQ